MAIHRMPAAAPSTGSPFLDERKREDQHARHGEEQRRVQNLAALHLDREVLLAARAARSREEHSCAAVPRSARYRCAEARRRRLVATRAGRRARRATRVTRPSARSRSCVASIDDGAVGGELPQPRRRPMRTARSSRPVNGSSSSTSRGSCSSARSSASRCRMPRENADTSSSRAIGQGRPARAPPARRRAASQAVQAARRTRDSAARTAPDRGAARARAGRCGRESPAPASRAERSP